MVDIGQLFNTGGSGVPPGDTIRHERTAITVASGEETILNVSGSKIYMKKIVFELPATTSTLSITSLKVTIDGEAERTLISSAFEVAFNSNTATGKGITIFEYPLEISAFDSLVVKITLSGGGTTQEVIIPYYVS
jgi:hypothetical protein